MRDTLETIPSEEEPQLRKERSPKITGITPKTEGSLLP